jgi:Cu+-exporting ATPase
MSPTAPLSPPATQRVTLHVTGMTCGTCAIRVRKALLGVPGVLEAEVNFATGTARVMRGTGLADDPRLLSAVVRAGYGATAALSARQSLAQRDREALVESDAWMSSAVLGGVGTFVLLLIDAHQDGALRWTTAVLATLLQIGLGMPFYLGAWRAIKARTGNMDLLVSLGATAGFALAAAGTFGNVHPAPVHFDCAPAVLTVVSLGKFLEAWARRRSGQAVRGLMAQVPPRAILLRHGLEMEVPIDEVRTGDLLRVPPNVPVPADGIVVSGSSRVNESSVTGEPTPVTKQPGDRVTAGTLNGEGSLEIRSERVGEETLLAQMAARVEAAQASRASASRLADRVASFLVPVVFVAAVTALLGWGLWTADWALGWTAATAVFLAACPCALGLAIPAALAVGVGLAARHGVLFMDVAALERASSVRRIFMDKTGTLTAGHSSVRDFWTPPGEDAHVVLGQAASAERGETHPLARAIVDHAAARGLSLESPSRVQVTPGLGILAILSGTELRVGSPDFLRSEGVDLAPLAGPLAEALSRGEGVVAVARGGRACGFFLFEETPRPEALLALQDLKDLGVSVTLLSGDRPERAEAMARTLGIPEVRAGMLPGAKADAVREAGPGTAMVGDGVNDAAALASAELGISLGTGADLAKEAAGVTLLRDDLRAVAWTLRAARATRRVILENLVWAFGYNALAVPLAMAGRLAPWEAAALMALSDLIVIGNALTLPWRVRAR